MVLRSIPVKTLSRATTATCAANFNSGSTNSDLRSQLEIKTLQIKAVAALDLKIHVLLAALALASLALAALALAALALAALALSALSFSVVTVIFFKIQLWSMLE